MKKATLITSIVLLAMATVPASAETNTYLFHHAQSTVVQTGGIADINETHRIKGYFQLTADFDTGVASFDWVDATLSKKPFLYTQNLGELFNMTNLLGTFLNDTTIKFEGKTSNGTNADISLEVFLTGDSLQLTGQISSPCCDLFDYELDAVASKTYPGWTYHYLDKFSTDKAKRDSYSHSIFWPKDAFPPAEPYLYYYGTGNDRALVFTGYLGQPAHLAYCFPIQPGPVPRTVRGVLQLDVSFPSNADISQSPPGYLLYSCSSDGQNWSTPEQLYEGHNYIHLESVQGTCYIIFLGTSAAIDNLKVHLHSHPATIRVPEDFDTIQDAIDDANDGDVIEVAPGTYEGTGNRDIEFRGKAITVRSANANGPEQTIIDCSGPGGEQHRGFYFHEDEKSDSVLRGFTIRDGRIHGSEIPTDDEPWTLDPNHPIGAGIYCEFSSPTIVNCVVKNCRTEIGAGIGCVGGEPAIIDCVIENCTAGGGPAESGGRGGGIGLIRSTNAKINNCIIKNNTIHQDGRGGGIYVRRAGAVIKNCDISFNGPKSEDAFMLGGGLYCAGPQTRVLLQNSIISHNWAAAGAAIFTERGLDIPDCPDANCPPCHVRVTNCTVAHNKLVAGPWMWPAVYAAIQSSESDIVVKNSIVWYNEGLQIAPNDVPVLYCDVQGGYPTGTGNINVPPLFAPNDVPDYDYHLQSRYGRYDPQTGQWEWVIDANHSPCIDAGDPKDPVGHEPTPNGKCINMGAYGGTRQAGKGKRLVYHVDVSNGSDANDGLTKETAFATIQKGIDSTKDGDAVMVWPGVYTEDVTFDGKAITVQSAADPAVVVAETAYAFSFYTAESSDSVLRNFVITNCQEGAAIFCEDASPTLTNLTIARNAYGIVAYEDADPNISNCIFWDNTFGDLSEECRARYSCIQNPGQHWSNISENPLFADPNNDDYHLRSSFGRYEPGPEPNWVTDDVNSPCIDAADPNVHPRRERMPNGGRLNMGAYGGTPYASMSKWLLRGDINHDGLVNLKDLAIIARKRMLRSDVNNDGLINMKDIAFATHRWLDFLPWAPPELVETDIVCPINGEKIPTPRRHRNRH